MNKPYLTIGMAACRNFAEVKFTVMALRMMHPEAMDQTEILISDNAPDDPQGEAVFRFIDAWVPNGRYIKSGEIQGTSYPRDRIFREGKGEWVIVIDPHVFIQPGAVQRFIEWTKANPESIDLMQGPMMLDDLRRENMATHFNDAWGAGMWGQWGTDARGFDPDAEPFEIQMHGLGLFACRRDAWPGFNPRFCAFGGEEGYIHEKIRQAGGKSLCLPFLRWWHFFRDACNPPTYQIPTAYRIRNYLIGFTEIGKPWDEILVEFGGLLTPPEVLNLQMEFGDTPAKWGSLNQLKRREPNESAVGLVPDGDSRALP